MHIPFSLTSHLLPNFVISLKSFLIQHHSNFFILFFLQILHDEYTQKTNYLIELSSHAISIIVIVIVIEFVGFKVYSTTVRCVWVCCHWKKVPSAAAAISSCEDWVNYVKDWDELYTAATKVKWEGEWERQILARCQRTQTLRQLNIIFFFSLNIEMVNKKTMERSS